MPTTEPDYLVACEQHTLTRATTAATKAGKDGIWERCKWAFSTHLHTIEDQCLRSMQATGIRLGRPICTLMFDGGHVRKLSGETCEQDIYPLLREMEKDCKETTGYEIKLTAKPFEVPESSPPVKTRKAQPEEDLSFPFEKDDQQAGDKRSADSEAEGGAKKRRRLAKEKPSHDPAGESDLWGETDSFSKFKVIKSRIKANISEEDAMEVDV